MPYLMLLKLIPAKDWLYIAIIVAIIGLFGWYTVHERRIGAQHEIVAIQKASKKATDAANKRIQDLTDQHAADVAVIEGNYESLLKDADTAHTSDLQRLRNADAYRKANPMLGSSPGGSAQTNNGSDSFERLERVSSGLADALRQDDAALSACYAERDSLTGK